MHMLVLLRKQRNQAVRTDWKHLAEDHCFCRKKSKSNLEALEEDLALKPNNGRPPRIAAPEGVERFSDDEEDFHSSSFSTE